MAFKFQISRKVFIFKQVRHPIFIINPHLLIGYFLNIKPLRFHFLCFLNIPLKISGFKNMHFKCFWFTIIIHFYVAHKSCIYWCDTTFFLSLSNGCFIYGFSILFNLSSKSIVLILPKTSFLHSQ